MTPAILEAIRLREEAVENCARANERRSIAITAHDIAAEGVRKAVRNVLREAFPGVDPPTVSIYVGSDNNWLSVVFHENHNELAERGPAWQAELVQRGDGWCDQRIRYGDDPVRLVDLALEGAPPELAMEFRRALGLVYVTVDHARTEGAE